MSLLEDIKIYLLVGIIICMFKRMDSYNLALRSTF